MTYEDPKIIVPRFNEESGFYTTKKHSKIMGKIRGKNTKPELLFRSALWKHNVRYRVDNKNCPENPIFPFKNTNWPFLLMVSFGMVTIGKNEKTR